MTRYLFASAVAAVLAATNPAAAQFGSSAADKTNGRNSPAVLAAFKAVVAGPAESVVRVLCEGKDAALGTVVAPDGFIVTKATLLRGPITCKLRDGRTLPAKFIGLEPRYDLAMLKIDTSGLKPIKWAEPKDAEVGNWVATVSTTPEPSAAGVISVAPRKTTSRDFSRPLPSPTSGFLGVMPSEADGGVALTQVEATTPAGKAGIKVGDLLLSVAGEKIANPDILFETMQKFKAGESVVVRIKRGQEEKEFTVVLGKRPAMPAGMDRSEQMNRLGSELSERRIGFPVILQHDSVVKPTECGGPLVDLDGKAVGVNIARAGRIESYAIPAADVLKLLPDLKSGKLAPPSEDEVKAIALTRKLATLRDDEQKAKTEKEKLGKMAVTDEDQEKELRAKKDTMNKKLEALAKEIKDAEVERERLTRKDKTKKE